MTGFEMDDRLRTRLLNLAAEARDALSPEERARRLARCEANGDASMAYRFDGPDLVAHWGGSELARIDPETLDAMRTLDELTLDMAPQEDIPDSPDALVVAARLGRLKPFQLRALRDRDLSDCSPELAEVLRDWINLRLAAWHLSRSW